MNEGVQTARRSRRDTPLLERHLVDLYYAEYVCAIGGAATATGGLGVLTVGRSLMFHGKQGNFEIRLNSLREHASVLARLKNQSSPALAAIDGPDRNGGYFLRLYGTGRDIVVDSPAELIFAAENIKSRNCVGELKNGSSGSEGKARKFALQWIPLQFEESAQGHVQLVELLTEDQHRKTRGQPDVLSFSIRHGPTGDALEQVGTIPYSDRGQGTLRVVEFRDVDGHASTSLAQLLEKPEKFLENWVQYELACSQRYCEEGRARATDPIEVVARLGTSPQENHQQYRVHMSPAAIEAWWQNQSFKPTRVRCVPRGESKTDSGQYLATLVLLERHQSEIVASFRFESSLPSVSQFQVLPEFDAMDSRQRERKLVAHRSITAGNGVEGGMISALISPEFVQNRPVASIQFPTMRAPTTAQIDAVRKALGDAPLVLIQGPPGTGKTDVICQITAEFIARNRRPDGSIARVLLAAQQHAAIDNLVTRLAERANIEVWRVPSGTPEAIRDLEVQSAEIAHRKMRELRSAWTVDSDSTLARLIALQDAIGELNTTLASFQRRHLSEAIELTPAAIEVLKHHSISLGDGAVQSSPVRTDGILEAALEGWKLLRSAIVERDVSRVKQLAAESGDAEVHALAEMLRSDADDRRRNARTWEAIDIRLTELESQDLQVSPPTVELQSARYQQMHDEATRVLDRLAHIDPLAAIKARFLQSLELAPRSWTDCCERHANSIGATCQGVAKREELSFDLAIIDEAAQVGLDVLLPISRARKVVLVGDQKQLPPYVESAVFGVSGASEHVAMPSLFESLWHRLPNNSKEVLRTQFRMNEAIGRVISKAFYEPELVLDHHDSDRTPRLGLFRGTPMIWVDTGSAIPADVGDADEVCNQYSKLEVELVGRLLVKLSQSGLFGQRQLGIACMYARQRDAILERLGSAMFDTVRSSVCCDTTDSFQGQEFEHAVVLCSRRGTGPGFLREPSRLNVALSRARRQVLLFADRRLATSAPASLGKVHDAMLASSIGCRFLTLREFLDELK
jgi:hypothetical protein